ncbi:exonuclease V [Chanos chanos]|uniref:Exonuclease V n=1 Tax=Chanos chanos TaxID=29144 RepID=A0A6J2VL06_CHACN|nr:exonuclease V [Chanos chanos]
MDNSTSAELNDWDGISDSEFLDIPLEYPGADVCGSGRKRTGDIVKCSCNVSRRGINCLDFMDNSSSEELDDWDGISDSEFLDIPLEYPGPGSPQPTCCTRDSNEDKQFHHVTKTPDRSKERNEDRKSCEEIQGVKRKIYRVAPRSPMERFRRQHLNVTLLSEQSWCEMKVVNGLLRPQIRKREKECERMRTGAIIHLEREMAIPKTIPVDIRPREDTEAVKLLHLLQMIPELLEGQCVREFPVFGVLEGVFFMGVIDELSYNHKGELVLSELKTRTHKSMPHSAQTARDCFQVGMYKLLFDGMVKHEVQRHHFIDYLKLRPRQVLDAVVRAYAGNIGVQVDTFGELLDIFFMFLTWFDLSCVDVLQLEYCYQGSGLPIGTKKVQFDEALLRAELQASLAYWTGEREPRGVDIEEAWKCRSCAYQDCCDWRKGRSQLFETMNATPGLK